MSTQPFSSLSEKPTPFTTEATEEHRQLPKSPELPKLPGLQNQQLQPKSLLDGPWKVRILPEEPEVPTAAPTQPIGVGASGEIVNTPKAANIGQPGGPVKWLRAPEPHVAKSLPWRIGDVTRLKDDSPKGMMEYIATHSTGWWQELAERALRDTEKAERMAREAGWQPGQCWALEVDAEAKQKLLDAEEAKRQREEAERAGEAAEKEAFMQRQMELLKKAGRAPRCEYIYSDGRGCRAPQVKGERWCHGHEKMMSYRPEKLEMLPMEDEQAVMVNLYRVTTSLLAGRITEKTAGLMLWSVAIGAPGAKKASRELTRMKQKPHHRGTETRRKFKNHSPQMNADERRSEKKKTARAKPKTFETQRNGGSRRERGCASRTLDGSTSRNTGASLTMTTRSAAKPARRGVLHSGVTKRKSFKSGVSRGRRELPEMPKLAKIAEKPNHKRHKGAQGRGSQGSGENSLNRHGQDRHSRGPSTPPHSPSTGSGSLGVGRDDSGKGHRGPSELREAIIESQDSVSPCLRGENNCRTTKPTEDEEEQRGVARNPLGLLDIHRLQWLKSTRWPDSASVKQCKLLLIMHLHGLALGMRRAFA